MTTSIAVLAAVAALAATACSFPLTVTGTVTALSADCGAPSTPAAALPGATVTVRCPGNAAPAFSATTDTRGRLRREIPGGFPLDCELVVTKEGHEPRTYAMKDVCADDAMAPRCGIVSFSARLAAVTAPGAP